MPQSAGTPIVSIRSSSNNNEARIIAMPKYLVLTITLALQFPTVLFAQETAIHPLLTDRYNVNVGMFFPQKEIKLRVDGSLPGDSIDFDEALRFREDDSTWALNFRWRFGEKWTAWGQYWALSDNAKATLKQDIKWGNVVFKEGTFAKTGFALDVARIFVGRTFSESPNHEFGLGFGLHWLELEASIEGQILTDMGDTELYRGSVDSGAPLPNIGGWYTYAFSPKWALTSRLDWLDVSIGDYSGGLVNTAVGIDWAFSDHFGLGASYIYFKLDLDVDKSDWHGSVDYSQHGPFIQLNATW